MCGSRPRHGRLNDVLEPITWLFMTPNRTFESPSHRLSTGRWEIIHEGFKTHQTLTIQGKRRACDGKRRRGWSLPPDGVITLRDMERKIETGNSGHIGNGGVKPMT